ERVGGALLEHRRVTSPERPTRTRKEGAALHPRSVSLSSERLGIPATLDLIEDLPAGAVYPVEYKHGSGGRDEAGRPAAWDNDAVQLCAQGMLLEEELGVPVTRGVLSYLGSRERVDVILDESLRAKT